MVSRIKAIDYQAKQITYNIYSYFKNRKKNKNSIEYKEDTNIIDIVSDATTLSRSTVTRIIREGNAMKYAESEVIFKPQAKKKHVRKKRILIDEITEGIIRRKVIQFYTVKNEVPSVRSLNKLLQQENILNCSNEYLRQLLHKLGFTNAETDAKGMLRERDEIVSQRLIYLQALKKFRDQNRDIFYFNETKLWLNEDDPEAEISNDLPTFVIVHANVGTGFLDGELLMMKIKTETEHSFEHFSNYDWVKDSFLSNIPPQSVVVINVSYSQTVQSTQQEEQPTMASTRAFMETWLNIHNISFQETASKSDLFDLINHQKDRLEFSITKIILEKGHEVLYLPKKHSDLNPVYIVWEELKGCVNTNTTPLKLLSSYPQFKWVEKFEHVKQNEEEYFVHDIKADDADHIKLLKKEIFEEELIIKSESDGDSMDCDF